MNQPCHNVIRFRRMPDGYTAFANAFKVFILLHDFVHCPAIVKHNSLKFVVIPDKVIKDKEKINFPDECFFLYESDIPANIHTSTYMNRYKHTHALTHTHTKIYMQIYINAQTYT